MIRETMMGHTTIHRGMRRRTMRGALSLLIALLFAAVVVLFGQSSSSPQPTHSSSTPEYTADGELKVPENYRRWVYLTTGFDMSYNPGSMSMDHHMFDNVFVDPAAYESFLKAGTWPDKTTLVLEVRRSSNKESINKQGSYQGTEVVGLEVHVKDESRFSGKWAFFGFDGAQTAKMIPTDMACYSCHSSHAAVDTTFVQFYPTLLPIAQSKNTLSAEYLKESK